MYLFILELDITMKQLEDDYNREFTQYMNSVMREEPSPSRCAQPQYALLQKYVHYICTYILTVPHNLYSFIPRSIHPNIFLIM